MSPAQQVLVKGVEITNVELSDIIKFIGDQFHTIEGKIAEVATFANYEMDNHRVSYKYIYNIDTFLYLILNTCAGSKR